MCRETQDGPLQPSKCQLIGAGSQPLDAQGYFKGYLKHKDTQIAQDIFVIRGLSKSLLGRPAIEALTIVTLVEPVTLQSSDIVHQVPKVL